MMKYLNVFAVSAAACLLFALQGGNYWWLAGTAVSVVAWGALVLVRRRRQAQRPVQRSVNRSSM